MPLFDVALLSVFTVSLYIGLSVLRRYGAAALVFGSMLLVDATAAAIAIAARVWGADGGGEIGEILGVVAIGGCICLVVVPPILRELARRALMRDHLKLARHLVDLRELLQPEMGSAQERELIDTIIAVRSGRIDEAIERLQNARGELEPRDRRRLDERIVMTYLYARMWPEAIEQYERLTSSGAQTASLQLLVEMVRAYCEADDLEAASELVAHLESSEIREDPALAFLLNRSRLVFLAFVGRTGAVERLSGPRGPLGNMPKEAGAFWSGLARHHAGDRAGAIAALKEAVRFSAKDKRARELAESALERAEASSGDARVVPANVAALADTLTEVVLAAPPVTKTARSGPPRLVGVALSRIPVTTALVAANVIAAAAIWLLFGTSADLGALVRAGANVKAATLEGQYWRWVTYQFIHVGLLHLAINVYGLWVLGKITEQLYGSRRILFIYLAAGIAGGLASTLTGPTTSAGASGAVFGLLGAALVELGIHRKHYPQSWTRSLTGLLLLLTVIQVGVGFIYPMIDQAAHLGGLAVGAIAGLALSKHTPFGKSRATTALATALAACAAAALIYAAVGLTTDRYGAAALSEDRKAHTFPDGVTARVPASWDQESGASIYSASRLGVLTLRAKANADAAADAVVRELHTIQYERARKDGFDDARRAEPVVGAPPGWASHELVMSRDDFGGKQTFRVLVFARRIGPRIVFGDFFMPEYLAEDLRPLSHAMLESVTDGKTD